MTALKLVPSSRGRREHLLRQALAAPWPAPRAVRCARIPRGTADAQYRSDYRSLEEHMTLHRSLASRVRRSALTVPVIAGLFIAATPAGATPPDRANRTDRALFTWTGRVDREVLIIVRGRDVRTRGFDAALPSRTRVNAALPRTRANVIVQLNDGRGEVDVIEQPSARNGYQAVLRVRDPRAGADNYRLTAYVDNRDDDAYGRRDDDRDDDRGENRGNNRRNGGAGALSWSGRVDDVVEIHISGRRVDAITRRGVRVSDVNADIRGGGLPNRNVNLRIDQRSGRGSISVVQQPSAWNGYTAIIRINDSRSGAAYYDLEAYWE